MNAQFLIPTLEVPQVKTGTLTKTNSNANDFFAREHGNFIPKDGIYHNLVIPRDYGEFRSQIGEDSYFRFFYDKRTCGLFWKRIRLVGACGIPMEYDSHSSPKRKFDRQVNCLIAHGPVRLLRISSIYLPNEILYTLKRTLKDAENAINNFHFGFIQLIDKPGGSKQLHVYGFEVFNPNTRLKNFTMEPNPQWLYQD